MSDLTLSARKLGLAATQNINSDVEAIVRWIEFHTIAHTQGLPLIGLRIEGPSGFD
ncbi:MAG: hypothetical protein MK098_05835 [Marinovum sp.]|nr:hypothetical protein [Marinovum sp.]